MVISYAGAISLKNKLLPAIGNEVYNIGTYGHSYRYLPSYWKKLTQELLNRVKNICYIGLIFTQFLLLVLHVPMLAVPRHGEECGKFYTKTIRFYFRS